MFVLVCCSLAGYDTYTPCVLQERGIRDLYALRVAGGGSTKPVRLVCCKGGGYKTYTRTPYLVPVRDARYTIGWGRTNSNDLTLRFLLGRVGCQK